MKKFLLIATIIGSSCYAQAQFRIGVKAGAGQSFHSNGDNGYHDSYIAKYNNYLQGKQFSYYAGVTADWTLSKNLSLQPSLLYSSKGGSTGVKYSYTGTPDIQKDERGEDRLNYLELPVNLVFKQQLGTGKVFAGAGLYEAMYLNGTKEGSFLLREEPRLVNPEAVMADASAIFLGRQGPIYPGKQADAKSWDTGANFTAGYELPIGLQIALNYSIGFSETLYGKNRVYSLSVGYLLHK